MAVSGYTAWQNIEAKQQIVNLTVAVDGRLTELLALTRKSSAAEGNLQGRADQKNEAAH